MQPRFHLAIPVGDIQQAISFYRDVLGCRLGRRSERWVDFDFRGHQITAHGCAAMTTESFNPVDGDRVPVPHFGLILSMEDWQTLASRLKRLEISFEIAPHIRFKGMAGEQATMFFRDPSGNALEFKAFTSDDAIFAEQDDKGVTRDHI